MRNGEKALLGLFVGLNLNLFTGVFLGDSSHAMASELASSSSGTDVILYSGMLQSNADYPVNEMTRCVLHLSHRTSRRSTSHTSYSLVRIQS